MIRTRIRDAADADLGAVAAVAEAALDLDGFDAASVPGYLWHPHEDAIRVKRVALAGDRVVGLLIGTVWAKQAFLDLLAVPPANRRRGFGQLLIEDWEGIAQSVGGRDLCVGGNLLGYAWPGVDIRYTAAICLLLRNSYVRNDIVYNMDLPISAQVGPDPAELRRLERSGIVLRRGEPETDADSLPAHARDRWNPAWAREVEIALHRPVPSVFVALRDGGVVGFAAHGVYRPDLYGPIATDPGLQGQGIGNALSRLCLQDMATSGLRTAQIGWVAESAIPFYSKTVGARLGRCFWMLHKSVTEESRRGR